jgi:hypothetical protein
MSGGILLELKCEKCGRAVEVCECCEEPDCKHVICEDCLRVAVGERRPGTYTITE